MRRPSEKERCPEPRTAKRTSKARRERGNEGGAHVAGLGSETGFARRRDRSAVRVKEKLKEIGASWG